MKLQIETGTDNPILRTRSAEVRPEEFSKFRALSEAMVKYVKNEDNGSVGVAAPQVGVNRRIVAISLLASYEDEAYRTISMFNPEILETSQMLETDSEGCLSVPGKRGDVTRPKRIKIRYQDAYGKTYVLDLSGLAARIVQHEVDHLNGILFTDKIIPGSDQKSHHELSA
jgi:peptide deformylase